MKLKSLPSLTVSKKALDPIRGMRPVNIKGLTTRNLAKQMNAVKMKITQKIKGPKGLKVV